MKKSKFSFAPGWGGGVVLLALVMMCAFALMSCDRDAKMTAGDATGLIPATPAAGQDAITESQSATKSRGNSSAGDFGGGGEEPMDGGPGGSGGGFDEEDEWDIRDFTDPRTQETYPIIDGRVIIAFKNPPEYPDVDPNYFDEEISPEDEYYHQTSYSTVSEDQDVADFVLAEELAVFVEWNAVKCIGALLPQGTSIEYAVEYWPDEYPDLIDSVDPDALASTCAWPIDAEPDDDLFPFQWAIRDASGQSIRIQNAWKNYYYDSGIIAILDTGVQRRQANKDLGSAFLSWGVNTYDSKWWTTFGQGHGQPSPSVLNASAVSARSAGHGTCVAGIIGSAINNDPGYQLDDEQDICGIVRCPRILPIAMYHNSGFSTSTLANSFLAIGCVKRIYRADWEYYPFVPQVPYTNIEVVNCSFGGPSLGETNMRFLDKLTQHMLFVAAAGNRKEVAEPRWPEDWPARHPRVLSVGAYKISGQMTGYSKLGSVFAPGGEGSGNQLIWTVDMVGKSPNGLYDLGYRSDPEGLTAAFSGTSAATPHVSAVAGMLVTRPQYSAPQLAKNRILQRATYDPNLGAWKLNAYETLRP